MSRLCGSRPVRSVRRHRRTSPFRMTYATWDPSRLCLCVADGSWPMGRAPGGRPPAATHDPNPRHGARISLPRIRRCACDKSSGAGTGAAAGHTRTPPPAQRRGRHTTEEHDDVGRFGRAASDASARDAPRARGRQRTPEPADHNPGWEPSGPSEVPPQHTHTRTSHHAAPATPARTRAAGVARDAAVRAPQLRHAPHQQISHRRGARFRGGQHRGVVPPGPKGWGVATPERNDATLARARRGREGGDSAQSGAGALVVLGLRSSPRTRTYEGGPE